VAALPPRACPAIQNERIGLVEAFFCGWSGLFGYERRPHRRSVDRAQLAIEAELDLRRKLDAARAALAGSGLATATDGQITIAFEGPGAADSARIWLRYARREIELLPQATSDGAAVTVVAVTDSTRALARSLIERPYRIDDIRRWIPDGRGGTCWVVLDRASLASRNRGPRDASDGVGTFLGWCALAARYGAPGPHIAHVAQQVFTDNWWQRAIGDQMVTIAQDREQFKRAINADRNRLFRISRVRDWLGDDFRVQACARGDDESCVSLAGGEGRASFLWRNRRNLLLLHLLATDGGAPFERFWQSTSPFNEAIEAAYAAPLPQVVRRWAKEYELRWNPGPAPREALSAFGWMGIALALAAFAGLKRTAR